MTAPGGVEVSRAFVKFLPDTSEIPAKLKAALEKIEQRTHVELPVTLAQSGLVADARRLAKLAEESAKVQLSTVLDGRSLAQQVKAATATATAGKAAEVTAKVTVDPLDGAFQSKVRGELRKLAATLELHVPAGVQGEVLRRQVSAQIKAVERGLALEVPTRPADAAEYRRRLTDQLRLVERTVSATVPAEVDLEVPAGEQAEVVAKVTATKRLLERSPIRIPLDVDTSSLRTVAAQITSLGGTLSGLGVGAVTGQAAAGGLLALASAVAQSAAALALIPAVGAAGVAVVGTLTLGLHGLSDALTADDPKKYAEALKQISPEARELVQVLRDLAPEARRLRDAVQDRLLEDLADDAEDLAQVYLPLVRRGLVDIAGQLRAGARELTSFAREAETLRVLRSTLDDSARAGGLLNEALRPAARGVRDLVDVGRTFLPGLAAEVAVLAERWSIMLERTADDGRLREWISQALDNIGDLAGIVGNVGRTFGAAFRAAGADGRQLLDVVRDITGQLADFAGSARGQDALGTFLVSAADLAEALLPLLRSVVSVVGTDLAPLLSRVGVTLVPALVTAVDAIGAGLDRAAPGIAAFALGVAGLITGLVDSGAIDAVGDLAAVLGAELGDALTLLGPKLGDLVAALAGELAEALPDLVPAALDLALALGDLLIAATPLIGVVADLVGTVGLPTLQRVAERLTPIVGNLTDELSDGRMADAFGEIADAAAEWVDEVAPLTAELVELGQEIVRGLLPHLPDLIRSSADLAETMQPLATVAAAVAGSVADISEATDDLVDSVPGFRAALGSGGLFGTLTSFTTPIGPLKGIYESVAGLTRIMQGEWPDAERSFVDGLGRIGEGSRLTFEELGTRGTEALTNLLGIFEEKAPLLSDIFLDHLLTMQDGQRSIFAQMLADLTDHWGRMDAAIAERTFGISDKVNAAWQRVADATRRQWEETERRVAEGINDVTAETSTLPGRVRDSLGAIEATLYPSGARLMAGFIAGMKSQEFAARRAAIAVMEIVSGAFPSSPAKWGPFSGRGWTPYRGAALVEGFAAGMTASIGSTVRAAELVATSVADQLPTGSGYTGAAVRGGAQVEVRVDARGTDPERVAAIVPNRILSALDR
ncbi:hypothetical protein ACWEFJ_28455 [Actinosynnema sp. NPDC004786]